MTQPHRLFPDDHAVPISRLLYLARLQQMHANGAPCRKEEQWFMGRKVRIWSDEHRAWWRAEGHGYTTVLERAGIYDYADARQRVWHCGPEKKILFERLPGRGKS